MPTLGKTTVLGTGAWGTALTCALARAQAETQVQAPLALWSNDTQALQQLREQRSSPQLPGITLPDHIALPDSLDEALHDTQTLVLAVPSQVMRTVGQTLLPFLQRPRNSPCLLINVAKGIEASSLLLMHEVIAHVLAQTPYRYVTLSGPTFALETAEGRPTSVVAASFCTDDAQSAVQLFRSQNLNVYPSDDPIGVELGGSLKNVFAIAVGTCDALNLGFNARAALITHSLEEMGRIAAAKQGKAATLAGLAGMGDLILTATGDLSRNRRVGMELAQGKTLDEVLKTLGHVAEGVDTARSAHALAQQLGVHTPIIHAVYRMLHEHYPVKQAVTDMLAG